MINDKKIDVQRKIIERLREENKSCKKKIADLEYRLNLQSKAMEAVKNYESEHKKALDSMENAKNEYIKRSRELLSLKNEYQKKFDAFMKEL